MLTRLPYRETGRTRHEYRLTAIGADLLPVLHALADWGPRYTSPAEPADPMRVIHQACGEALAPGGSRCSRIPGRDEIAWLRPWRSQHPVNLASPVTDAGPPHDL